MSLTLVKIRTRNAIYTSTQDETGPAVLDAITAGVALQDVDLAGADLSGLDLTGGDFQRADLTGADLSGANLTDANFQQADLTGADLTGATVTRADFRFAILNGTLTDGADFSTASMQGAAVVNLDGALGIGVAPAIPVADGSTPGLVQLSGDLGGTATAPTVVGLAGSSLATMAGDGGLLHVADDGSVNVRHPVPYCNTTVPGGNTIAATVTPTAFASSYTIPGNLLQAGHTLRASLRASYALDGVSLELRVKIGGTVLFTLGPSDTAGEAGSILADLDMLVLGSGAGASLVCSHRASWRANGGAVDHSIFVNDTPVAVDLSEDAVLTVTATWDSALGADTVTLHQLCVEHLALN